MIEEPKPKPIATTDQDAVLEVIANVLVWFEKFAQIEDKNGGLVTPVASKVQREIMLVYRVLTALGERVRICALPKARQSYVSTISAAILYHHWRRTKCNVLLLADEGSRLLELWTMLQRFHTHDGFENQWGNIVEFNTETAKLTYRDEKGRKRESFIRKDTASDADAGAATARQFAWLSEACLYPREGDASDTVVIGNILASIGKGAETVVLMESRAKGPGGYGFSTWQGAVTLEERMDGSYGNGWVKVFCAWHEVAEYVMDKSQPEDEQWFNDADPRFAPYRDREQAGIKLYGWSPERIAWRRWKLLGEMDGKEAEFDSQFPESPECAFRASGDPRFHPGGTANLEKYAKVWHPRATRGTLEENAGSVRFLRDDVNGWLLVHEPPTPGTSVCMFADVMTGEQSAGSKKRDCHAPGIMRESCYRNGVALPTEVVAVIDVPGGCRFDIDYLAEKMALLSRWYDDAICVPEANGPGIALILALKALNVPVWQRQQPDALHPGKTLKVSGFRTDTKSRDLVVEAAAKALRESSGEINEMVFRCFYEPAAVQFSNFVITDSGKCEAGPGYFDDWVMGIAIALHVNTFTAVSVPRDYLSQREPPTGGWACS